MKEILFLKNNAEKWKQFESLLKGKKKADPDQLANLFIELTDDLSYAKTSYPGSKTEKYLNALTSRVHQAIYRNKKEERSRLIRFWKYEHPSLVWAHKREMLFSLCIFIISMLIGVISSANDESFVRLLMGDAYVRMTLDNIEKGDPMAVFKSMNQWDMFLGVTVNNIIVAMKTFVAGVLVSFGAGLILFFNGVILGAFNYFFYQKGLLLTCILSIGIHGTLEISSIIIAGGAGIVIGNSILFPGTYSRMESFKIGAKRGLKILVGIIPLFVVAGTLEGFVTRYTGMPRWLSSAIILASISFLVWYYIIYPARFNLDDEAGL